MASRIRRPETETLVISGGDTLTVKRFLTAGEFRQLLQRAMRPLQLDPKTASNGHDLKFEVDPTEVGLATTLAYLLDWSFTDYDGRPVLIRDQPIEVVRGALDSLDADSYLEVQRAIQAHDTAVRAWIAMEKKTSTGSEPPAPSSPSAER